MAPASIILGCEGLSVTAWERDFFSQADPFGFILFARNCQNPDQVRDLVRALRGTVGRSDAPVLIDQEGGRVARLKPPHWRAAPPARRFGEIAVRDPGAAREATRINALLLALELRDLGIDVDCLPVLDVPAAESHNIIGDRAFGEDADLVIDLGAAQIEGLLAGGVLPVVKHMPGHGRGQVDSHHELPVVESPRQVLEEVDFRPFRAHRTAPMGMTAHVVYTAFDPRRPATTSAVVIEEVIRGLIGFEGVLISDDLSMSALKGDLGSRTAAALEAGCDLALHCNGKPEEMAAVAAAAGPISQSAAPRIARMAEFRKQPEACEPARLIEQLDALLETA